MSVIRLLLAAGLLCCAHQPAVAESTEQLRLSGRIVSDYRLRGLSWSAGKPTLMSSVTVPITSGTTLHASAFGSRGSVRVGGADMGLHIGARHSAFIGPVRADVGGSCRAFIPAKGMIFCEIEAGASFDLVMANLYMDLAYAPGQSSIGGSNVYAVTGASIAIPRSPVSIAAHIGRSIGTTDDLHNSRRLRPHGNYWDYGVGATMTRGRVSVSGRYFAASAASSAAGSGFTGGLITEVRLDL